MGYHAQRLRATPSPWDITQGRLGTLAVVAADRRSHCRVRTPPQSVCRRGRAGACSAGPHQLRLVGGCDPERDRREHARSPPGCARGGYVYPALTARGALEASRPAPPVRTQRGRLVRVARTYPAEAPGCTCQLRSPPARVAALCALHLHEALVELALPRERPVRALLVLVDARRLGGKGGMELRQAREHRRQRSWRCGGGVAQKLLSQMRHSFTL